MKILIAGAGAFAFVFTAASAAAQVYQGSGGPTAGVAASPLPCPPSAVSATSSNCAPAAVAPYRAPGASTFQAPAVPVAQPAAPAASRSR